MKPPLPYPVAILAGGIGTRMLPRTEKIPKALLEVADEPFVAHQLALLRDQGIRDVVLCVSHFADQIEAFVGDGRRWGIRVRYSPDGPTRLGTGGALRRALPLLGESFFVLYGDSYLPCDFAAVAAAFEREQQPALMTVFRNDDQFDTSNVLYEGGRIVRYDKQDRTSAMHHIDYGLSMLRASTLAAYPAGEAFDLARVFQDLVARGALAGVEVPTRFYEIGSDEGLRDTDAWLRTRRAGDDSQ